ncbi:MAG: hypothetical protein QOJ05_437 [Verrucomicrobiota bacterium]|jgi:hypothetical protein
MNQPDKPRPHFYFSLLRLLAGLRGGNAGRAENNWGEACLTGIAVYLISYLFFAQFVPDELKVWQQALLLVVLVFFICLFWLIVLYLNSLILGLLRLCGLLPAIPVRRAQSVLLGISASAMAWSLLEGGSWPAEIGAIWLIAVAMNLAAAAILALRNDTGDRAE